MTQFPATPSVQNPAGSSRRTIQTSIQPQSVFPQQFTQAQGNLAAALATPAYGDIAAGWNRPGLSMGGGAAQYGMGLDWGRQMAAAQMAPQQIAQQHQFANLANILQGQVAREQEAQQWGQMAAQQQAINDYQSRMAQQNVLMMLLGQRPWW